jgi:arabinose-5-phosphate isomerase
MNILDTAKEVFRIEAAAISQLEYQLTDTFIAIIDTILSMKGKLIISGMGKSGIIGKKIAATLASTGTPSFFLHPAEAYHGDLGMIEPHDIVLLISHSGETDEVLKLIPFLQNQGNITIAMSANAQGTLSKNCHYHLNIAVEKEACPLQLAPTSSTTATLVMGDALAVTLMHQRDFRANDFATYHPGGSLGRKLLTKVKDIMRKDALPTVQIQSSFPDIITTMTQGKLGLCVVFDTGKIVGIITDGDLRRALLHNDKPRFDFSAEEIMSKKPKSTTPEQMAYQAEEYMIEHKISELLVIESEKLVGIVQLFDTNKIQ